MSKPHLISTSAHYEDGNRILEYVECYNIINGFKENFQSITVIETISDNELNYLTDTGFNVFYSKLGNSHQNKGVNWLNHVSNFLSLSNFEDNDIIIFITGRYHIINLNILSLIDQYMIKEKYEMIAKDDIDLKDGHNYEYEGKLFDGPGVHTFYFAFTKSKFLDFSIWYRDYGRTDNCVEWCVKRYMKESKNCKILSREVFIGVKKPLELIY